MKYYTETIPPTLAEKLKEKGMPIKRVIHPERAVIYGRVFDWLMEKKLLVSILPSWDSPSDVHLNYEYQITELNVPFKDFNNYVSYSWHEAANAAIEKALTLI